jgi:CheY-like chemotaxis protein
MNIKLLIIENDEGKIGQLKKILGEDFYSFDYAKDWQVGLKKISANEYDIVILSFKYPGMKNESPWFFKKIESEQPDKLNIPYVIFKTSRDDDEFVSNVLKGKNFYYINKDKIDYHYEIEWAIINVAPKAFYRYRDITDNYKAASEIINNNKEMIQNLDNKQKNIEDSFVSWRSIAETLGIMVGAFSLTVGITIAIISLLFQQSMVVNDFGISLLPLIVIVVVIIVASVGLTYLFFKKKAKRIIEKEMSRILQK